ncbi:GDSL lipase/esterase [Aspergillus cavernicola]|uniref:GDSL lipase/esterase n=1 Tax=Aspergillus cavernicola TaxID=176166 RepID=A0ABR4HSP7_9EURO
MVAIQQIAAFFLLSLGATLATPSSHWGPRNWRTLVTFGNSYTDENRLDYFEQHDGEAPPVGWVQPINNDSWSGGHTWGYFASQSANLTHYYSYAVAGAVCSNYITPRTYAPINAPYPSLLEYEIPAYIADSKHVTSSGQKFMDAGADETVYAIWIGTNDVGNNAFLTDSQVPNTTIPDYLECVYEALDGVYANGGRYFVIMNLAPLQLAPQYATPEHGGLAATPGYLSKGSNITEISYRMWESVVTINEVYHYKTPYEAVIAHRYPGAQLAVMDTYGLISDIYHNPIEYLTAPTNVTGYIHHCALQGGDCERRPNETSYLWYDELHPSARTMEIIGKEFVAVVEGNSEWVVYW